MTQESVTILKVETGEAVKSVGDLRDNIKILKGSLDSLEIGSEEYQKTLGELRLNQNALKDAMYATATSMEDISKSAKGAGDSYNALVHKMADMKAALRNIDTSTEEGMDSFKSLAGRINAVNDKLKELDEMQGNYQRNVGNYKSALNGLDDILKNMPSSMSGVKGGLDDMGKSMKLLSTNPLIGIISLLSPLIVKITEELKGNETAIEAVDKAMGALKPVTDFFATATQKLAEILSDLIGKVAAFVQSNGLFQQIINGLVGVGNAILQYVVAPFKGVIAAIKVFKEEGIKGFKDAGKAFAEEMKSGFSFKSNFEAGKAVADGLISGVNSKKKEVVGTIASAISEGVEKGVEKGVEDGLQLADAQKALENADRIVDEAREKRIKAQKEIDEMIASETESLAAEVEAMFAELDRMDEESKMKAEKNAEDRINAMFGFADAASSILGALADVYDSEAENNAKSAEKAKGIRIAQATLETIAGAISAYMGCQSLGQPQGAILGAVQAAAVMAAGRANIAKIKATNITTGASGASANSAISPTNIGAIVPAPSLSTPITAAQKTNAYAEDILNKIEDQKVYLVYSELEAAGKQVQTQNKESSY